MKALRINRNVARFGMARIVSGLACTLEGSRNTSLIRVSLRVISDSPLIS